MDELAESWKNYDIFQCQLDLNLREISSKSHYPRHWIDFIELVRKVNPKSILDVGCGCGTYYKLCDREFSGLKYVGIDYSKDAIDLAKKQWMYSDFYVMDYRDLSKEYVLRFDLIHVGGLLAVLSNGDEVLDFLLSLQPKNLVIGRISITDKPSYYDIYKAYDKISTYEYHHNKENFEHICKKHRYNIDMLKETCLLKKEN